MAAEIHRLTPAGPMAGPEQSVIELLKDLLVQAKKGEIKGLGVFYVEGGGQLTTDWASGCATQEQMAAGASRLQYRTQKAIDDNG